MQIVNITHRTPKWQEIIENIGKTGRKERMLSECDT